MACAVRKKEQEISRCKVFLNGRVAPHVQANIVKQMLNYLMFQRNQIPMTFEQLKLEFQRQNDHAQDKSPERSHSKLPHLVQKRLAQLISTVEDHLANIDEVFTSFSRVPRVLILFGATAVSPKEVHEIVFFNQESTLDTKLTDLRTNNCLRVLMRTLISDSAIWEAKQLPLTNTVVLVYAHRNSGLTWFKPKISFKSPTRAHLYSCEVHCGCHDDSKCACGMDCKCNPQESEPETGDDFIWYQSPAPIKALQAFPCKETSNSIWA